MRRTVAAIALLLLSAPAQAAGPQITDPAGDANFSGRELGTAPASFAAFDIRSVRWHADRRFQYVDVAVTGHDPQARTRVSLYAYPYDDTTCGGALLTWTTGDAAAHLAGCKPRHQRAYAAPVWSGNTLRFAIPRAALPPWFAPGFVVEHFAAYLGPYADFVVGAAYPAADGALADAHYVVGT